jgi:hypothetical protein
MICANAVQQPDGSYLLVLDPTQTDYGTCAYVVESGSETAWASLPGMSIDNALVISGAIAGLWALAWGFRQLIGAVGVGDSGSDPQ